jgi:hypothetical protein
MLLIPLIPVWECTPVLYRIYSSTCSRNDILCVCHLSHWFLIRSDSQTTKMAAGFFRIGTFYISCCTVQIIFRLTLFQVNIKIITHKHITTKSHFVLYSTILVNRCDHTCSSSVINEVNFSSEQNEIKKK